MRKRMYVFLISILSLLMLTSCNMIIGDKSTSITINGKKEKVLYTGALSFLKPKGNGFCTSKDNSWDFSGYFENGILIGNGYISNYPCKASYDGREFDVYYTGEMTDGNLSGNCKMFLQSNGEAFYAGKVDKLQLTDGQVKNLTVTIKYLDEQFEGLYSGKIVNGKLSGDAVFDASEADFKYEGNFSDGAVAGLGRLYYDNYVVHFKEVDRKGRYNGYVEDGIASGDGIFNAINSEGVNYTYNGRFKDGIYNGKGELSYGPDGAEKYIGTFTDGEFTPNKSEFLKWYSDNWFYPFEVNGMQQGFINNHEHYFQADESTAFTNLSYDSFIDSNYDYDWVSTIPAQYFEKMILTVAAVGGTIEDPQFCNENVTNTVVNDYYGNFYVFISTEPIDSFEEGENVVCIGLPIDKVTVTDEEGSYDYLVVYTSFIMNRDEFVNKYNQYNK